jgi:hypothetical protein
LKDRINSHPFTSTFIVEFSQIEHCIFSVLFKGHLLEVIDPFCPFYLHGSTTIDRLYHPAAILILPLENNGDFCTMGLELIVQPLGENEYYDSSSSAHVFQQARR